MTERQRCKERVAMDTNFLRYHQCSRYAKKDGYCTTHHPEAVAKRRAEKDRKYEEQQAKSPYKIIERLLGEKKELIEVLELAKLGIEVAAGQESKAFIGFALCLDKINLTLIKHKSGVKL